MKCGNCDFGTLSELFFSISATVAGKPEWDPSIFIRPPVEPIRGPPAGLPGRGMPPPWMTEISLVFMVRPPLKAAAYWFQREGSKFICGAPSSLGGCMSSGSFFASEPMAIRAMGPSRDRRWPRLEELFHM